MTTNYAQQVQKILGSMNFNDYKKPTAEQMQELLTQGRSRILAASDTDQLCSLSVEFFPFCWSVVGRFGAASYNAVEIASLTKIQPIFIACAIHEYGLDWAYRLFTLKRLVGLDRGPNTIVQGATWHWSVSEIRRRVEPTSMSARSKRQTELVRMVNRGSIEDLVAAVKNTGNLIISVIEPKRRDVFRDPRPKLEAIKRKGNGQAMTVVTPKTEKQRWHQFAVHPYPVDKTKPSVGAVRRIRGGHCVYQLPN